MSYLNVFSQSYKPYTTDSSISRVLNMYAESVPKQNSTMKFLSCPGHSIYTTLTGNVIRGMKEHKNVGYVVSSNKLFSIVDGTSPTVTELGTLTTSTGRVSIDAINDQVLVADGTKVWSYTISTTTFAEVTDADLPANVSQLLAHLGYFIFLVPNSDTFYVSDLNDGTSVSALSFASAELDSDNLVAGVALNQSVWMLGETSTELWYNSGAETGAPYDRRSGGMSPIGCAAPFSAILVGSSVFWLGQSDSGLLGIIRATESGTQVVSTAPMLEEFNSYVTISDAFGWTYTKDSHIFYVITFPSSNGNRGHSWQYDLSTGLWSELESANSVSPLVEPYTRHTANAHIYLNGKHLIGDHESGIIYRLTPDVYTQNGTSIIREIVSDTLNSDSDKPITINKLELEIQSDIATDDITPEIEVKISHNKGRTWSVTKSLQVGLQGEYQNKFVSRCGTADSFVIALRSSSAADISILGVKANVS